MQLYVSTKIESTDAIYTHAIILLYVVAEVISHQIQRDEVINLLVNYD